MDRPIKKKKWPVKKIIGLSLILIFAFFIIYTFIFGDSSSKLNVELDRITISTVTRGEFQEFIPIIGNVMPIVTVYLDAIEGGRVEEKYLEAGALVKVGDKILRFGNTDLLLNIMFREAEFFEQSNNLRTTRLLMEQSRLNLLRQLNDLDYQIKKQKRLYERQKELAEKNLIARQEYEQVEDEYDYLVKQKELAGETFKQDSLFRQIQIHQLESSLDRMQTNLEVVKKKLEGLTLKAPISGQLTSLNAEIGELKNPGERLGQIDVLDSFKVRAGIDEYYISRVEVGRTGSFDLSGESYNLIVKKIFPEVREGRFEVDLNFIDGTPPGIRRGQTLHIRLNLGDLKEAILLPKGGFYQRTGGQWVYVLDKFGDYAYQRKIKIGQQNTQVYEILEGLEPGEKVITSSYDNFGDKEKLILK
ncbi:MAG TPA: HlyD family efflux transporter periplasmic adaptor subunit [bacterium]